MIQGFGISRGGADVFGASIERVDAIGRQGETPNHRVFDTDQIVEGLFHLQFCRGSRRLQRRASRIAQLHQHIDRRTAVFGISQQRDDIARAPGECPGDFADRLDDIGFVEFAAACPVIAQIDIFFSVDRLGFCHHLHAEFAPLEAAGFVQIEDECDQKSQQQRHDHGQQHADRPAPQLHHKQQDARAHQPVHQQDVAPIGCAGHFFGRAVEHGLRYEERYHCASDDAHDHQQVLSQE